MTRQEKTKQILQAVEEYLNTPVLERNASQGCFKYLIKSIYLCVSPLFYSNIRVIKLGKIRGVGNR